MPAWTLKSTATKMLHSLTNGQSQPRERKGSIDIQVHTQRAFFVEPARESGHVGHRHRLRPPYAVPPKYEKEFARPRPKPLKLRTDENVYPVDEKGKEKGQLVDRRRRYGVTCYPDGVREELRRTRTRSRSPKLNKLDLNSPRFGPDRTISPSLYSNRSGFGEQITVSSAKDDYTFEPPSWFSDHTAKSQDDFCNTVYSYQSSEIASGRILSGGTEHGPELDAPLTAKSWETFRIPSIPPSPVDSTPSTESVPVAPRDPRLPPADYLLYKEMYDEAMIRTHGKLPAEWVAYSHRHHAEPSRI